MYTFTYQKILLRTLLMLDFKIVKCLQCIIKNTLYKNIQAEKNCKSSMSIYLISCDLTAAVEHLFNKTPLNGCFRF